MESAISAMSTKHALRNFSLSSRNVQLARRSPGEGLSTQKPYDVGLNFTHTQFLNSAGQGNPDR